MKISNYFISVVVTIFILISSIMLNKNLARVLSYTQVKEGNKALLWEG